MQNRRLLAARVAVLLLVVLMFRYHIRLAYTVVVALLLIVAIHRFLPASGNTGDR